VRLERCFDPDSHCDSGRMAVLQQSDDERGEWRQDGHEDWRRRRLALGVWHPRDLERTPRVEDPKREGRRSMGPFPNRRRPRSLPRRHSVARWAQRLLRRSGKFDSPSGTWGTGTVIGFHLDPIHGSDVFLERWEVSRRLLEVDRDDDRQGEGRRRPHDRARSRRAKSDILRERQLGNDQQYQARHVPRSSGYAPEGARCKFRVSAGWREGGGQLEYIIQWSVIIPT